MWRVNRASPPSTGRSPPTADGSSSCSASRQSFPFTLLNYLLGLTRVRFPDYLVASVGMLPGTVLYVVLPGRWPATSPRRPAARAPTHGAGYYAVVGLGLVATIAVTLLVTRTARRALHASGAAPRDAAEARP